MELDTPELDIPDGAVVLNQLHIIEYLDPMDDEIYKVDLSTAGDNSELPMSKALELIEWARAFQISPLVADMVLEYVHGGGEDDDDEEAAV